MTAENRPNFAGDSPEDTQLWHTYFNWPRQIALANIANVQAASSPNTAESFLNPPPSNTATLQTILFTAFALEYRLKRAL
jgi:hypothetical protein